MSPAPNDTRDRLIAAMRNALQRRGLHGIGLTELLLDAQAPKGVLYHHFPGGKGELAVAAIDATIAALGDALDALLKKHPDPLVALETWVGAASHALAASGFERGCPLATVALESTPDDAAIRQALARGFARMRGQIAASLTAAGQAGESSEGLAALIVAAYEGGLLQARVAQDAAPMLAASRALMLLLRQQAPR